MTPAQRPEDTERAWWLRTLLVLQAPRSVFAAFEDDSEATASARQEPVTAIVFLAGVAIALAAARDAALLDDPTFDGVLVAVWAVAAGGVQGLFAYWLLGAAVYAGVSALGSGASFKRARHLLAYAAAPLAFALFVVWPVRLAAFGGDPFRAGGSDKGSGALALDVLEGAVYVWFGILLVLGVRVQHGWSWGRSLAACGFAAGLTLAVAVAFGVL